MLTLVQNFLLFKIKWVFLGDAPFDVKGCHAVVHFRSKCEHEIDGFSRTQTMTAILDLTQEEDVIWRTIHKNTRRDITQARNKGVKIHINTHVDDFITIMKKFQRRKGFRTFYLPSKKTIQNYGTLFIAEYDGEVLAGALCLEDQQSIFDWLGCSKRFEKTRFSQSLIGQANRLLIWEVIKYAKAKGLKTFDFGGLWREDEVQNDEIKHNMNKFKLDFGVITEVRNTYRKTYSPLFKIGQNIRNILLHQLVRRTRPD
jgi:lipid II:glycine glycyltransferase (peptidoglycan interpeptide bridge formation enzyme)